MTGRSERVTGAGEIGNVKAVDLSQAHTASTFSFPRPIPHPFPAAGLPVCHPQPDMTFSA